MNITLRPRAVTIAVRFSLRSVSTGTLSYRITRNLDPDLLATVTSDGIRLRCSGRRSYSRTSSVIQISDDENRGLHRLLSSEQARKLLSDQRALVSESQRLASRVAEAVTIRGESKRNTNAVAAEQLNPFREGHLATSFCVIVVVSASRSLPKNVCVFADHWRAFVRLPVPSTTLGNRANSTLANQRLSTRCLVRRYCQRESCRRHIAPLS
jgi:hypothetical protein